MKNVYFSHGTLSEQRLFEDLIIESLQIYGHDVYYLPREFANDERLFGEDPLARFDENYLIEMYLSNYEGFEGDGTLLTKFGVRIAEEATFIISKRRWEDLISSSNNLLTSERPNEGDVIYFPLTNQLFQIKFVEHQKQFRQLNKIQTYQLICEVMEYADERLETGVPEIDKLTRDIGYSITFSLTKGIKRIDVTNGGTGYGPGTTVSFGSINGATVATASPIISSGVITGVSIITPGQNYSSVPGIAFLGTGTNAQAQAVLSTSGTYVVGETVFGGTSGATGKVTRYDVSNKELELIDIVGTFINYETLIGEDSDAEWINDSFSSIEKENDDYNENAWIEEQADNIVDWSERNPFGEYTNMGVF
jgi:hypothetical protein